MIQVFDVAPPELANFVESVTFYRFISDSRMIDIDDAFERVEISELVSEEI